MRTRPARDTSKPSHSSVPEQVILSVPGTAMDLGLSGLAANLLSAIATHGKLDPVPAYRIEISNSIQRK